MLPCWTEWKAGESFAGPREGEGDVVAWTIQRLALRPWDVACLLNVFYRACLFIAVVPGLILARVKGPGLRKVAALQVAQWLLPFIYVIGMMERR